METDTTTILSYLNFASPTGEQESALLAIAEFVAEEQEDDFLILSGAAGTGKTSITAAVIGYLNKQKIQYKVAAPTSRAARILGKKTNVANSTIHSLIYLAVANPETGEVHFRLKEQEEEEEQHRCIFIIDEASMINAETKAEDGSLFTADNSLLNDLVTYIKDLHPNNKLLLLGDRNQLPPIGEQESYALVPEYLQEHYDLRGTAHVLTTVKRQEDGSNILTNAIAIRQAIDDGAEKEDIALHVYKFPSIYQGADQYARDYKANKEDHCVTIGCTHNSNRLFNKLVRQRLYGLNVAALVPGDLMLVMQTWTREDKKLYNGDHVVIEEVHMNKVERVAGLSFVPARIRAKNMQDEYVTIEDYILLDAVDAPEGLAKEKEKSLRKDRYAKNKNYNKSGDPQDDQFIGAIRLTYGHAITCNKAQGGEWDKVYVNTRYMPTLKWMYTAITRAKTTLVTF